jgi:hypothetical protein
MKKMKKTIFVLLALLLSAATSMNAQVTIGSDDTPNTSAVLDLSKVADHNLGLLLPSVALLGASDPSGVATPVPDGLMVYNNGLVLTQGVYVWGNSQWNTVNPPAGPAPDNSYVVALDGHAYTLSTGRAIAKVDVVCPPGYALASFDPIVRYLPALGFLEHMGLGTPAQIVTEVFWTNASYDMLLYLSYFEPRLDGNYWDYPMWQQLYDYVEIPSYGICRSI